MSHHFNDSVHLFSANTCIFVFNNIPCLLHLFHEINIAWNSNCNFTVVLVEFFSLDFAFEVVTSSSSKAFEERADSLLAFVCVLNVLSCAFVRVTSAEALPCFLYHCACSGRHLTVAKCTYKLVVTNLTITVFVIELVHGLQVVYWREKSIK